MKQVELYTDGACSGNPGKGGYGIVLCYGPHRLELSGGYRLTTNNRKELMAALEGSPARSRFTATASIWSMRFVWDGWKTGSGADSARPTGNRCATPTFGGSCSSSWPATV